MSNQSEQTQKRVEEQLERLTGMIEDAKTRCKKATEQLNDRVRRGLEEFERADETWFPGMSWTGWAQSHLHELEEAKANLNRLTEQQRLLRWCLKTRTKEDDVPQWKVLAPTGQNTTEETE